MDEPGLRTRSGRDAAVSQLLLAHHRRLVGLASVLVDDRESAEEVVRGAFLTLYRRPRLLRDRSAAVAHLDQCVVDGGVRQLRRERSPSPALHRSEASSAALVPFAAQGVAAHPETDGTWRAICSLPRRQREVVVLKYHLEQSDLEIARTVGIPRGSIGTLARRGLATLGPAVAPLVAEATRDHAEQAMSRTDTESELHEVLVLGARLTTYRRRRWAVAGLVSAALVVPGGAVWPTGDDPDPTPVPDTPTRSVRPMNADEQLAHDFVSAYFSYDRRLAASYVAHGVTPGLRRDLGERGWIRQNRLEQALGSEHHLDGCFQIATTSPDGVRVGCLYTVNILGLGEVGYGPYSGNLFAVTVRGGTVDDFVTALGANDYDEEAWGPFRAWVEDTHASEVPALDAIDDPDLTPSEVTRTIRAWRQVARAYLEALRSGEVP